MRKNTATDQQPALIVHTRLDLRSVRQVFHLTVWFNVQLFDNRKSSYQKYVGEIKALQINK